MSLSLLVFAPPPALAAAASFIASVTATPIVIKVARAKGLLAKPRSDRWHKRPTALFGGVAIFAAFAVTALAILPWTRVNAGILLGAAAIFGVGLVDDVLRIKPSTKLIGQIAAASIAVLAGVRVEAVPSPFLFVPLTIVWIVAVTNAFNLIDNMDGLSAGVAAISSFFIGLFAWRQGNAEVATLTATLGGAAAGFLLYNFNPARVFMGDCGSMVLGYVLGASALVGTWKEASNLFLLIAAPALLLGVPLFDATLVTVLRTLAGRPVSQGGRDHSSHRLVALGLSERRAVVLLWSVCVTFGLVALGGLILDLYAAAVGALLLLVGIFFFGVYLGQVPVYGPAPSTGADRDRTALVNTLLLHKRRIAEVSIDFALICAAYASAYLLRFEGTIPEEYGTLILQTLPILIVLKMSAFFLFGVYRGVWRYVGIRDLLNLVKAVAAGSVATVIALLLAYRFQGLSRSVFILDGLLLLFFTTGARLLIRVFRETLGSGAVAGGGRRILIVGAGDGGEMLLREIRNNPSLGWTCVGLVDDNREKHGRQVHGVTVLGGREELKEIAARAAAEEIVIAIPSASGETIAELAALCAATGLPYRTTRRVTELVEGRVTLDSIRDVEVLDVVQRRPERFDQARVREAVAGRAIAIVGAGGTIGTAIAMRALAFAPARVLLLDRDDNALLRLGDQLPGAETALADAADEPSLEAALSRFRPDVVIHAAALNQFRLLESCPARAAEVNVLGTRNAARVASRLKASFILVSSTKAAATSSVLGATRRLAEIAAGPGARVVRLGNVLGSRGGILARFRDQAIAGGPITVTDPEAARFVLAAEEAAAAVLLATGPLAPPVGERVLFPDHGPQVRIAEVATAVARWAAAAHHGRSPEIRVVGLRPGEALRDIEPPSGRVELVPGLTAFAPEPIPLPAPFFDDLERACAASDDDAVRDLFASLPGFGERVPSRATVVALPRRER